MCLSEKSALWSWLEVTKWLYENKLIKNKDIITQAAFFANINAALEERDLQTRKQRRHLLSRISVR